MQRTTAYLLWADALAKLSRIEALRKDFCQPTGFGWEPPVDVLETAETMILVAAMPGVRVVDIDLAVEGNELAIVGIRQLPPAIHVARVHRMELPHGRFERRVALPPGRYELVERELADGCLTIILRKLG
ncbi:MAG: heat shock protein Hsp20 [Rubritepida sp.]|nr:heat shock protein Hsp20 [Rubritepida sp.]